MPLTSVDKRWVQDFCDLRYIALPASPNDGDILTYDAATDTWIASPSSAGTLVVFSAYDHTGAITIGTSATDLTYDTEVQKDSIYTHTTGAAGVTVSRSGLYYVSADIGINVTAGSTASYVDCYIAKNGTEIEGTRGTVATLTTSSRGSITISRLLSLTANDVIKVQGILNTAGNTTKTIADMSRLTIVQVEDTGGGSGLSGSPIGLLLTLTYP